MIVAALVAALLALASCTASTEHARTAPAAAGDVAQAPNWSRSDLEFFLHGSMSSEFVPERVLTAFIRTYPDLFPRADLASFGLIPDGAFGWPIGLSRRPVPHLGGLSSVGVNCASCHLGEVTPTAGGVPVRVLGMPSHF